MQHNSKLHKFEKSSRRTPIAAGDRNVPPGRESRRSPHGDIFVAGTTVRESGIYEVLHDLEHRTAHEVVMIAEDLFPTCEACSDRVRYRVLRTAPYIFSDEDFEDSEG
jgi:hypothetical protein